ncbi:MBL fold metallo-hydrolase [Rossellomorea aquimaris]|uniref:MBL fold metallo-hydrolase n=1 Tax=Rossellomorea aquimaris TaxID=189382 RepID=UPI001CD6F43F|nr:MBL fold metallo-hydrolase [Rossellomorea aquimaris]MCA1054060.1 MBL fold metallo-hydrolase [Rossellomorea aquimaris]
MSSFSSNHFTLEKISENVYAAIAKEGSGSVANAGFVQLGNAVLVFDTFNTQQASEDLKHVAEAVTNLPVKWVVNSHWHGDHIRGNQTFKGSTIISSENTFTTMQENHPSRIKKQRDDLQGLTDYIESLSKKQEGVNTNQITFLREIEKSLPTLELVLPNQTFKGELKFHGTNCHARLFTLGGGHSVCDAMMYIPEERVLFMGDLLFVDCHPTILEESNIYDWHAILIQVENLDIDTVIPGHGSVGTKDDLTKLIQYFEEILVIAKQDRELDELVIPHAYKAWTSSEFFLKNIKVLREFER